MHSLEKSVALENQKFWISSVFDFEQKFVAEAFLESIFDQFKALCFLSEHHELFFEEWLMFIYTLANFHASFEDRNQETFIFEMVWPMHIYMYYSPDGM